MTLQRNLVSLNTTGAVYQRTPHNEHSIVDVTLAQLNPRTIVTNWCDLEDLHSASDHFYVSYILTPSGMDNASPIGRVSQQPGWAIEKLNIKALISLSQKAILTFRRLHRH